MSLPVFRISRTSIKVVETTADGKRQREKEEPTFKAPLEKKVHQDDDDRYKIIPIDGKNTQEGFCGIGLMIFTDRSYRGEIKDDSFEGHGTLTYHTGEKVTGTFKADYMDGIMTREMPDGRIIQSEYKMGAEIRVISTILNQIKK